MTAAAGSLVLLCIATGQFEKRSRIFEKKNIYYQFLYHFGSNWGKKN
jgi:hypothetical protein